MPRQCRPDPGALQRDKRHRCDLDSDDRYEQGTVLVDFGRRGRTAAGAEALDREAA